MTNYDGVPQPGAGSVPSQPQPGQPAPLQPTYPVAPSASAASSPYAPYSVASQPTSGATQQPYGAQGPYGSQTPYGAQQAYAPSQTYEAEPVATASQSPAPKGNGGKTFLLGFAGALVACVLAFGIWGAFGAMSASSSESAVRPTADPQTIISPNEDASLPEVVAAKCLPSVVAIDVYAPMQSSSMSPFFGYDFGFGQEQGSDGSQLQLYSQGSGVVLSEDGYIITNNHVIDGGSAYNVTVAGETYDAELVGADPSSDIAVLKAKSATGLTPMEIGDSDNLTIGEWVMSLGSPFGLEQSVATGIVSATSRSQIMDAAMSAQAGGSGEVTIYPNMIQTDAAINPGNSGGALVDGQGKLIGINTLITSYSGNYSGVGFAIPVNYAINLAQQIIAGQTPTHAQLGVSLSTVDASNAQRYGLAVDSGAYVAGVASDSGAAVAGIVPGDIITAFDGMPVESASDLMLDVRTKNPGDVVTLTVNSSGHERDVEVTLGDDSASQQASAQQNSSPQSGNGGNLNDMLRPRSN